MNCKKFKAQILLFQDRQLTEAQLGLFENHRCRCRSCAETLARMEEAAARLAEAGPVPVPDFDKVWRNIAIAIAPQPAAKFSFRFSPRLALLGSGFLVFFIMGIAVARLFLFTPAKPVLQSAEAMIGFTFTVQDYFAALQPVISEYSNILDNAVSDPTAQGMVRRLLGNLYLLKLRAEKTKDTSLLQLLADIELVLLEIAHLDRSNPEKSRLLGALIQEKGISLKMKVFKFADRKSVRI